MESKAKIAIAIAVVAIIAVAGACVYFFFLDKGNEGGGGGGGEDVPDHYEVLRDPRVGDKLDLEMELLDLADQERTGSAEDYLKTSLYYGYRGSLDGSAVVTFKGKDYDCSVYKENGTLYYVASSSGIVLKVVRDSGEIIMIEDTNLDVTKKIGEQTVNKGTFYSYVLTENKTEDGIVTTATGKSSFTVSEKTGDMLTYQCHSEVKEVESGTREIVSVSNGVYKFKNDDREYTKTQVMMYYSYSSIMDYLKEVQGDTIKMLEKTSATMDTEYGERTVTVQKAELGVGLTMYYTFYYGQSDVLYSFSVYGKSDSSTIDASETYTWTLKGCDAVTTV